MNITALLLLSIAAFAGNDVIGTPDRGVDDDSARRRCAAAQTILQTTPSTENLAAAAALLPRELAARVLTENGRTDLDGAWRLLRRAVDVSCAVMPGEGDDVLSTTKLEQLARDPRFVGIRHDDDLSDQLLDQIGAWLERLLESEAMVAFSEQTRTVYLTGLAIVAAVLTWRLRRRRRPTHAADDDIVAVRREQARQLAFQALRDDGAALVDSDPRQAALRLRQALLARLGEVDADAARPSRTASEIIARLTTTVATTVTPALSHFDVSFYGGVFEVDAARTLLRLVDEAAAALAGRRGQR